MSNSRETGADLHQDQRLPLRGMQADGEEGDHKCGLAAEVDPSGVQTGGAGGGPQERHLEVGGHRRGQTEAVLQRSGAGRSQTPCVVQVWGRGGWWS